jgi:release factor glutamine methyltransferase
LLEWASGHSRAWLTAHSHEQAPTKTVQVFLAAAQQRQNGQPVAYIMGEREFYGLNFVVSPATLIPRADTEVLVDWLISRARVGASLLELGTGTGCIAISVAHHRPDIRWTATDIDPATLSIAQHNALKLDVRGTIEWQLSNWYQSLAKPAPELMFDGIVSNPPYIAANDGHLEQGDLRFEPRSALTDNNDGLRDLHKIIQDAKDYLKPNGFVALEHGYDQGVPLRTILQEHGFIDIQTHLDLAGRDRFTVALNGL